MMASRSDNTQQNRPQIYSAAPVTSGALQKPGLVMCSARSEAPGHVNAQVRCVLLSWAQDPTDALAKVLIVCTIPRKLRAQAQESASATPESACRHRFHPVTVALLAHITPPVDGATGAECPALLLQVPRRAGLVMPHVVAVDSAPPKDPVQVLPHGISGIGLGVQQDVHKLVEVYAPIRAHGLKLAADLLGQAIDLLLPQQRPLEFLDYLLDLVESDVATPVLVERIEGLPQHWKRGRALLVHGRADELLHIQGPGVVPVDLGEELFQGPIP